MKAKRNYIFILIAVCLVLLLLGVVFLVKGNLGIDENAVTRYEWLEMLGEQLGINEYTNESSYFSDVHSENPYYPYIQSAVEWNVIDVATDFEGDDYASGKFIALTAMRAVGENKLKICLDLEDAITDDTYIELAVEYGLIEEERLKKGFSKEECEQILEILQNLYFGELWKDDYYNVTYQEGVIELSLKDVIWSDADCTEIVVTDKMINSFEVGNIIMFEQENTKLKYAREITGIGSDGTLSLSAMELDKVVESLIVSDITELTFEDIVSYYGLEENAYITNTFEYQPEDVSVVNTKVFDKEINSKGYKISLSTEGEGKEKHLEIKITDNATGVSYALPISDKVDPDSDYNVEIDIDKLYIGGQFSYTFLDGLEYAEAAVDAHATFNGTINSLEKEQKIRLFKTPVPLGNGLVGVDIQIYIVLSVEGGISFEAELPVEVSVSYEQDKGLKNFKHNISVEKPSIEVNCSAGAMLRLEPTFVVLGCLNVMDAEADIGINAKARITTRPNSQICADISVAFPVITFSVCGDDDADTIIGNIGLSAEWEIISSDDAPIQFGLHCEFFSNQIAQFVDECTYGKQEETLLENQGENSPESQEEVSLENQQEESPSLDELTEFVKYYAYELPIGLSVNGPLVDSGDYYTIKGSLIIYHGIGYEEFDSLSNGDSFWILDKQFTKGEGVLKEGFPELIYPVYCLNDGVEYYICTTVSKDFGKRIDRPYYYLYDFVSDYEDSVRLMEEIHDDWDASELKIAKEAIISTLTSPEQSYTAEECYNNNIFLNDYYSMANYTTVYGDLSDEEFMFFNITFNEKGVVDSMILYSYGLMAD